MVTTGQLWQSPGLWGKRDIEWWLQESTPNLASSSRFCYQGLTVPDPLREGSRYVETIVDISKRWKIDVIIPMTEPTIEHLNKARNLLPMNTTLACPEAEIIEKILDKNRLYRLAEKINVPIPETLYIDTPDDLPACIEKISFYPVVIKPAKSRIPVKRRIYFMRCDVR